MPRTVWSNTATPDYSIAGRIYVTSGTTAGSVVGVAQISDAGSQHAAVDAHVQSTGERVFKGVTGAVQLGTVGFSAGTSLVRAAGETAAGGEAAAGALGEQAANTPARFVVDSKGIVTDTLAPNNVVGGKSATEIAQELGKAGETAAGIAKNTQRIESLSGKVAYRIPDELTPTTLTEVKNVAYQHFSTQLQDSLHYAIMTGRQMILKVAPDTVLSKELQDAIRAGWIKLEFIP